VFGIHTAGLATHKTITEFKEEEKNRKLLEAGLCWKHRMGHKIAATTFAASLLVELNSTSLQLACV